MTIKVQWQRLGLAFVDAVLVALALYAGYMLRFEFSVSPEDHWQYLFAAPVVVTVRLACFWGFWLYRGLLRYASTNELLAIMLSVVLGSLLLAAGNLFVTPLIPAIEGLPEYRGHVQRLP